LRRYETTFIVNPQADDAAIDRQVEAVVDLIKSDGGNILHEQRIGTRRLAYPIAGLVQGFYASILFEADSNVLTLLERLYKLEEPYIRYLTIRYDGKLPEAEEPAVSMPDEIKTAESKLAELTDTEQPDKPVLEEKPEADSPAPPVEEMASPEMAVEEPAEEAIVDPKPAEAAELPAVPPDPTDEEL